MSNPRIFTFWEPKDKIPGYIRLCMKTWERFLPDYEVTLLDYAALKDYLAQEEIDTFVDTRMSLAKQADCIRCILLDKWGGIWMDADTIIRGGGVFHRLLGGDASVIRERTGLCLGAFLYAAAPHAEFYARWRSELERRMQTARRFLGNPLLRIFRRKQWRVVRRWDYCENAIIDSLADELKAPGLSVVFEDEVDPMPERVGRERNVATSTHAEYYRRFWFEHNEIPPQVLERNAGLIFLHNSWTPEGFRNMTEEEFLASDCSMARLLRDILEQGAPQG